MAQAYSDPKRESDPYSLPDIEVWYVDQDLTNGPFDEDGNALQTGWYWWACFPGCLPDSDPVGPFNTEDEALQDARDTCGDDED